MNAMTKSDTQWAKLAEHAYKYPLTTEKLHFLDTEAYQTTEEHKEYQTVEDFLPAGVKFPSEILNLEQLYRMYMWLDKFVRIRTPKLIYSTNNDGFNITTLYMKVHPFKDDFKSMFFIIKTTNDEIFGAYLDFVLYRNDTNFFENEKTFVF